VEAVAPASELEATDREKSVAAGFALPDGDPRRVEAGGSPLGFHQPWKLRREQLRSLLSTCMTDLEEKRGGKEERLRQRRERMREAVEAERARARGGRPGDFMLPRMDL
jgi:hypothetical protein